MTDAKSTRFLIVSHQGDKLDPFTAALAEQGIETAVAATPDEGVDAARELRPTLVVVDQGLLGDGCLKYIIDLLMINAMTHTAVMTGMEDEEFHERFEGLGVLTRLPETPKEGDAVELVATLRALP